MGFTEVNRPSAGCSYFTGLLGIPFHKKMLVQAKSSTPLLSMSSGFKAYFKRKYKHKNLVSSKKVIRFISDILSMHCPTFKVNIFLNFHHADILKYGFHVRLEAADGGTQLV